MQALAPLVRGKRFTRPSRLNAESVEVDEVKAYLEGQVDFARETGYVETVYGRRLYLPEINSRNRQQQQAAERAFSPEF